MGTQAGLRRVRASKLPTRLTAQSRPSWGAHRPPQACGCPTGPHRPGEEDRCFDKDWFQELWASESLSATPNILAA